jgi:hypothetical protein
MLALGDGAFFIDRNGSLFGHILSYLRDPGSFALRQDLTESQRAELVVEAGPCTRPTSQLTQSSFGQWERLCPLCDES